MAILRALALSLLASLLSIAVVLVSLNLWSVGDRGPVYSPYWDEIVQLKSQAEKGITPDEMDHLSDLIDRNNRWHEARKEEISANSVQLATEAWQKRSSALGPGIMVLWGALFYFFFRRRLNVSALLVLAFPVWFTGAGMMSVTEFGLIVISVLAVWLYLLSRSRQAAP